LKLSPFLNFSPSKLHCPLSSVSAVAISSHFAVPSKSPPLLSPFFCTNAIMACATFSFKAGLMRSIFIVVRFLQVLDTITAEMRNKIGKMYYIAG
jgi:hypothetical protein